MSYDEPKNPTGRDVQQTATIARLERELAEANVCERDNFRRAEHNLARAEAAEREHAALREDAERWRGLMRAGVTYHESDGEAPVLASVSKRIWYHATDDQEHNTLAEAIDAYNARGDGPGDVSCGAFYSKGEQETEQKPGGGELPWCDCRTFCIGRDRNPAGTTVADCQGLPTVEPQQRGGG